MDASGGSSANTTDEEAERSTPTPPAVTLTSATRQPGSSRNRSTASPRSAGGVAPSSRTKPSTRRARSFAFSFSFSFSSRVSSPAGPRPGRPTRAGAPRAGTRGRRCRTWFAMPSMTSLWCAKMTILGGAAASSASAASPSAAALASGPPSSTRSTSLSHLIAPGSFTSAASRWRDTDFLVVPRDAPREAFSDARSSSLSPLVSPLVSLVSLVSLASPSPSPSPRRWAPCRAVSMGTTCLRFGGRSARTCVFRRRIITSFVSSAWSSCSLLPPVRSYAGAGLGCSAGFGFGARATSFKSQ